MNASFKKCQAAEVSFAGSQHRALYFLLLENFSSTNRNAGNTYSTPASADFLATQIAQARKVDVDLPSCIDQLEKWCEGGFVTTGRAYQQYLSERRAGGGRRYFSNKSHAIDFINKSAPTKLVDGSWLYGVLQQWPDPRFRDLIRTYLEELGDGKAAQNHVALYRRLLATHDCNGWAALDDCYFLQGAIQLALASQAENFLPEIIGFNLGYEQLPLHLLITAYELAELDIDPYYFTLHITIDNFDNGHARRAIASVKALATEAHNPTEFYNRVMDGYRMNFLGTGAASIIDSFDIEREVINLLTRKAAVGQYLHCDRCKIQGRTINEWLSRPAGIPDFLRTLESCGWIKRHDDPANSRFWKLIDGDQPLMFGVFDSREKQLIFDWISGDWVAPRRAFVPVRTKPAELSLVAPLPLAEHPGRMLRSGGDSQDEIVSNLRRLAMELRAPSDHPALLNTLVRDMSPASHDSERGLMATRIFADYFYGRSPAGHDQHAFMSR